MSYILDALRRSQAERERGQVPGLGAQPVTAPSSAVKPRRVPASLWGLLAASVLVLLAAAAVVTTLWTRRTVQSPALPASPTAASPAAIPGTPGATAPVAVSGVAPTASPPVVAVAPAVVLPAPPVVVAASPSPPTSMLPSPWPTVVSAPPPSPGPATTQPAAAPRPVTALPLAPSATVPASTTAAASVQAPAATPAVDTRPVPYAQLSAEQRRDLPSLQVSGSIWSDNAASRFVMLNGMVMREGDMVAPGLKLERIAQKSAVLRWRDVRFEIGL